jgi:hypothetical protein
MAGGLEALWCRRTKRIGCSELGPGGRQSRRITSFGEVSPEQRAFDSSLSAFLQCRWDFDLSYCLLLKARFGLSAGTRLRLFRARDVLPNDSQPDKPF